MSRVDVANAAGLALALALSMLGAGLGRPIFPSAHGPSAATEEATDGSRALRDATGALVPLRRYRRIASASLAADRVLLDLAEPSQVVAFTRYARETPSGHRYAGKPAIGARDDPERLIALKPDLVVLGDLVGQAFAARLREQGIAVYALGPMRGLDTLVPAIRALGQLLGEPARGERYAATLVRRMEAIAARRTEGRRPRALYLSTYGGRLFSAAARTSYHDVILHAGLADAAAERGLTGWPELTGEQVLAIDPDVLIARTGMGDVLCRHPGLGRLRVCSGAGRIIELDGALLDDPGPGMLEATEALYEAFWTQ